MCHQAGRVRRPEGPLQALPPGTNVIKKCGRNLQKFMISYSACPLQASPAYSNVCGQEQERTLKWSTCGLYYKHTMIVNDTSNIINKLEALHTDDARVIIYDHHVFIKQATE
jgi:hypothetical protein